MENLKNKTDAELRKMIGTAYLALLIDGHRRTQNDNAYNLYVKSTRDFIATITKELKERQTTRS